MNRRKQRKVVLCLNTDTQMSTILQNNEPLHKMHVLLPLLPSLIDCVQSPQPEINCTLLSTAERESDAPSKQLSARFNKARRCMQRK
ncbi:hypothetical protein MPH_07462 [Macrophomina phaseolina MS6]|uniref:Uncharacterized protein n=1 Tax=Macrophomina phaseolina (strain MS6) TaxID=1126212 RepID=K2RYQ6_MACPH|nr:hypothetical protein MPH_07462 [Macrophomina phaseolina MS6]